MQTEPPWVHAVLTLITALTTLVVTIFTLLKQWKMQQDVTETKTTVNGRMELLLQEAREKAALEATAKKTRGPYTRRKEKPSPATEQQTPPPVPTPEETTWPPTGPNPLEGNR